MHALSLCTEAKSKQSKCAQAGEDDPHTHWTCQHVTSWPPVPELVKAPVRAARALSLLGEARDLRGGQPRLGGGGRLLRGLLRGVLLGGGPDGQAERDLVDKV